MRIDIKTSCRYGDLDAQGGNPMTTDVKRATIYMDPALHKALKLKSIETSKSISELVNQAIKESLSEDADDIAAYQDRIEEPLISYSDMVRRLKDDGIL